MGPGTKVGTRQSKAFRGAGVLYIKDAVRRKLMKTHRIGREHNLADTLTHHLGGPDFNKAFKALGCGDIKDIQEGRDITLRPVNTFKELKLLRERQEDLVKVEEMVPTHHIDVYTESVFNPYTETED